ncbi:hypothetical protein KJY73_05900 [Bowmanella sp. Y26]|uniref:hypothetical protein n=1 Tax=Bowmanella yangjiangensis TaxID=2811230 RepID=UPI001BDCCF7F|nr:hypothetical protein [Bowmanella yangjiangensis]MBT1063100.1 hypothetical protein [Bowmanella yangjiangensis]
MDILAINDIALSLHRQGQHIEHLCLVCEQDKQLLFDQQALAKQRLVPGQCTSSYWQQLSLEPIKSAEGVRHAADLAHQQLLTLAEKVGASPVLVAVPASLTQTQLSLLLGIMRETPWQVTGLINTALASLINGAETGAHLHIALHSKQSVITELTASDNLSQGNHQLVSGVGLDPLCEHLMKHLARRFIQEQRFDPMHQGSTEQALYLWVRQYCNGQPPSPLRIADRSLTLDNTELTGVIRQFLTPLYQLLDNSPHQIWLSHHLARLPGVAASLPKARLLSSSDVPAISELTLPQATSGGISLIDSLPRTKYSRRPLPRATHLLYEDHAVALQEGHYGWLNNQLMHSATDMAFSIHQGSDGFVLSPCDNWQSSLAGHDTTLSPGTELHLRRGNTVHPIRCIRVMP